VSSPDLPPIPVRLSDRPLIAGLVVPWITARTPDGRHRFGAIDADRAARALHRRWCQICGQPLGTRFVFAMRDSDLARDISAEAGMHPECFQYSITTCPMLAGRMEQYRSAGHSELFADVGISLGDPHDRRAGRDAEPWNAVWAGEYTVITDPATDLAAALLLPNQILRVRPLTRER
jgi:hypothetical protein